MAATMELTGVSAHHHSSSSHFLGLNRFSANGPTMLDVKPRLKVENGQTGLHSHGSSRHFAEGEPTAADPLPENEMGHSLVKRKTTRRRLFRDTSEEKASMSFHLAPSADLDLEEYVSTETQTFY